MTDQRSDTAADTAQGGTDQNQQATGEQTEQGDGASGQPSGQRAVASANAEGVSDAPTILPPTDIIAAKDALIMLLDVPGADPETLDVALDRQELRVSARSTPSVPQGYTLVHAEYQEANYERVFTLSDRIDDERIEAVFKDGVLRLTLPKATPSAKKIQVKAA
jgi:HSP20 family molecular chaperone IbpA